jgi:hypothetical protein
MLTPLSFGVGCIQHGLNGGRVAPMSWYALALLLAMSLLFTLPGSNGGLFHSSAALWPWFMALAAIGLDQTVAWLAQRPLQLATGGSTACLCRHFLW